MTDETRKTMVVGHRSTMKNANVACGIMNHAKKWLCSLLDDEVRFHAKFDEDLK